MPALLGQKIAYARHQRRLSQIALAQMLGMAKQAHISNVETGKRAPSLEFVVRCADVLGVSVEYLVRDSIPPEAIEIKPQAMAASEVVVQSFGAKLKHQRELRGWSQTDLANQLAPLSQAYISELETGRKFPSIELVVQCADLFHTTVDYWVRDTIPVEVLEW